MGNLFLLSLLFGQTMSITPRTEIKIKIHTTKEESYLILAKNQPLEIKASGPTWLRVYTRIPWSGEKKGTRIYKIILQEDDIKEKFITQETEYSSIARFDKMRLSKWRSFYINVPEGLHTYRLIYWRAPQDTILLRVTYEAPGRWQDIPALSYSSKLNLVEDEKVIDYYEATPERPVILEISGPKKIKIISRLNLLANVQGEQVYSITVKEKEKKIKSVKFNCYRSETVEYNNQKDILPSNPHNFYINVPGGTHRYEFIPAGNARISLRFLTEVK